MDWTPWTLGEVNSLVSGEVADLTSEENLVFQHIYKRPFLITASSGPGADGVSLWVIGQQEDLILYWDSIEEEFGIGRLKDGKLDEEGTYGEKLAWALRRISLPSVETVEEIRRLPADTSALLIRHLDDAKAVALCRFPHLYTLFTDGNSVITDLGLQELAGLQSLRRLDLEWSSHITDSGLGFLTRISNLEWLDLSGCERLTPEGIEHFQRQCPNCHVERDF